MTLEECYTAMGANYQDVLKRFYKSDMIRRFVKMFLQDDSFRLLTDAMAKQDVKEAFRAAHTLKGVCLNLGFDNLSSPAVALTEILRAGTFEGAAEQYAIVKTEYDRPSRPSRPLIKVRILSRGVTGALFYGVRAGDARPAQEKETV